MNAQQRLNARPPKDVIALQSVPAWNEDVLYELIAQSLR